MKQIKEEENFTSSGNGHEVKIINLNLSSNECGSYIESSISSQETEVKIATKGIVMALKRQ